MDGAAPGPPWPDAGTARSGTGAMRGGARKIASFSRRNSRREIAPRSRSRARRSSRSICSASIEPPPGHPAPDFWNMSLPSGACDTNRRRCARTRAQTGRSGRATMGSGAASGRDLAEGAVLVDADLGRKPEHPLGDDVAQDLVGAARDAHARRREVGVLPQRLLRREVGVDHRAHGALQLHREGGHLLAQRGAHRLSDRALGARGRAAADRRERAVARVLEALRADVEVRQLLAHRAVLDRGTPLEAGRPREAEEVAHPPGTAAGADGDALVHERGQRHAPAVADAPEPVLLRDADVVQEDLVEARGAVDLADRAHLDPGRVHVDDEVGEARVLRGVGIGAGHDHPEVAEVGERAPDLLSGEHPPVAAPGCARAQAREVAARAGLAEELAPDDLAARHLAHPARLLLRRAVRHDRRTEHPVPDRVDVGGRREAGLLLVPDRLFHAAEVPAPVLLGPGEAGPARVELARLPGLRLAQGLVVLALAERVAARLVGRARLRVLLEPGPGLGAEGGLFLGVVEVHRRAPRLKGGRWIDLIRSPSARYAEADAASASLLASRASMRWIRSSRQALGVPSHAERSFARR